MTSRVSSKNKEKKAKRKNSVKKKGDQTGKKKTVHRNRKEHRGLSARASISLTTAPQ